MSYIESPADCGSDNEQFFDANETNHRRGITDEHSSNAMLIYGDDQVTRARTESITAGSTNTSRETFHKHDIGRSPDDEDMVEDGGEHLAVPSAKPLHLNGCHSEFAEVYRMTDTPPPPSPPPIPVIPRDCSIQLKQYDKFCRKASTCIPQLSLARHRYWIGVLNLGVRPLKSEFTQKDFTWMMGNRLTCIETVWHSYSTQSGSIDFVLHCAGMKMDLERDKKVEMQALDYFNNKKVYLRAVDKDAPDAEGKKLIPDEEPELIEIDD